MIKYMSNQYYGSECAPVSVPVFKTGVSRVLPGSGRFDSDTLPPVPNVGMIKALVFAALFAVPLGAMVFVPLWFVLAFLSRLITGRIHLATFVLAGFAAAAFMVWVFRLAFGYFRKGNMRPTHDR